jgi:hypothetical protein
MYNLHNTSFSNLPTHTSLSFRLQPFLEANSLAPTNVPCPTNWYQPYQHSSRLLHLPRDMALTGFPANVECHESSKVDSHRANMRCVHVIYRKTEVLFYLLLCVQSRKEYERTEDWNERWISHAPTRFELIVTVTAFWDVTQCCVVSSYQCLEVTCCHHHHGRTVGCN